MFGALRLVVRQAILPPPLIAGVIVLLLALASAFAVAVHVWFERPVMAWLRARLTRRTLVSIPVIDASGPAVFGFSVTTPTRVTTALIPRKWMRDLVAQLGRTPTAVD